MRLILSPDQTLGMEFHEVPGIDSLAMEALGKAFAQSGPEASMLEILNFLKRIYQADLVWMYASNRTIHTSYGHTDLDNALQSAARDIVHDQAVAQLNEALKIWMQDLPAEMVVIDHDKLLQEFPGIYQNLKDLETSRILVIPVHEQFWSDGFAIVLNPDFIPDEITRKNSRILCRYLNTAMSRNLLAQSVLYPAAVKEMPAEHSVEMSEHHDVLHDSDSMEVDAQEKLDLTHTSIHSGAWSMQFNTDQSRASVYWSTGFRQMLGIDRNASFPAALESWSARIHPDEREQVLSEFVECLAGHKNLDVEYRLRKEDGSYEWFHTHGTTAFYPDGQPRLFCGTLINVQEQVTTRQSLMEAYEGANRANAAKTEFLSAMSHDIRTPLNGIIGMTAIANTNIHNPEKLQHCLREITTSSNHLLALVNEVLDMNKIESGKVDLHIEEFSLADLIEDFITLCRPLIASCNHTLVIDSHDIVHEYVMGDSSRLQQCLMNFMGNAIKYTPEGGRIHFSLRERPAHSESIACYEFVFEDNGIGMEESFIPSIFEPFARARDDRAFKQQGTGLGMPITRNIIRMMSGDVTVESRLNEGSTFTATAFLRLQPYREVMHSQKIEGHKVLVIDSDIQENIMICDMLAHCGMETVTALSLQEAIDLLETRPMTADSDTGSVDAVLMEVNLEDTGEKSALDTIAALRERLAPDTTLIAVASNAADIESDIRHAGADYVLGKPVFESRLVRMFEELYAAMHPQEARNVLDNFEEMDFSGFTVLLAEDNEINAFIAEEILTMTGIEVEHVWNGRQAVEALEQAPEGWYDLVFMDIQMPLMDGYQASHHIRTSEKVWLKEIPIIALSANTFEEDKRKAMAAGMNDHLPKPLDFDRLLKMIAHYLHHSDLI